MKGVLEAFHANYLPEHPVDVGALLAGGEWTEVPKDLPSIHVTNGLGQSMVFFRNGVVSLLGMKSTQLHLLLKQLKGHFDTQNTTPAHHRYVPGECVIRSVLGKTRYPHVISLGLLETAFPDSTLTSRCLRITRDFCTFSVYRNGEIDINCRMPVSRTECSDPQVAIDDAARTIHEMIDQVFTEPGDEETE